MTTRSKKRRAQRRRQERYEEAAGERFSRPLTQKALSVEDAVYIAAEVPLKGGWTR